MPVFCKWITVRNGTDDTITIDRFASEILAVAEEDNPVETRAGVPHPVPQILHVETDFAFGGFNHSDANCHVVHWRADPQYTSIVNYTREQPTQLVVSPDRGPSQDICHRRRAGIHPYFLCQPCVSTSALMVTRVVWSWGMAL